ncbi:MAG: hypothetical protein BWX84_00416 [Verrucomicrobia bacterium ADurb.Bin118]|nr:MAG: hypothetical protein BWX84_00416 [Verrucomicrobia bacterium ADurb.Bin118]
MRMLASLAASMTLMIWPNGARRSALMASFNWGLPATWVRNRCLRPSTVTGRPSGPTRKKPSASTVTTNGASSWAPVRSAWVDSGSASRRAGCCLKVVVTVRKITITISTSISATMMIGGI